MGRAGSPCWFPEGNRSSARKQSAGTNRGKRFAAEIKRVLNFI
jgi:hypothetical protein